MTPLLLSFMFLTVLPVRVKPPLTGKDYTLSLIFFPITGLFIGALLSGLNILLLYCFKGVLIDAILVLFLTLVTGALHMDGLSDTFDGMMSGKKREEALNIMKDSHIGAMGVISIIFAILLTVLLFNSIPAHLKTACLLTIPMISRWNMVFVISLFSYARSEGKAKPFFDGRKGGVLFISSLVTFVLSYLIFGIPAIALIIISGCVSYLFSMAVAGKLGGITGDTIGAVNEISKITMLISILIIHSIRIF